MTLISPVPKLQFFDANGNPLAGGKIYTYLGGTSTPANTYTDFSGNTANPNPVILDAAGMASIWIDDSLAYKYIVKDKNDVLLYTTDNINEPPLNWTLLTSAAGSSYVGYQPSGSTSVVRNVQSKLREWVSVKDFGAVGDGVTDDTAAIQAAIDYAKNTATIECVVFPTAIYATTGSISIYGSFGAGGLLILGCNSTINCSANAPAIDINGALPSPAPEYRMNLHIQDLDVSGPGKALTSSSAVRITSAANIHIVNCTLRNAYRGIYALGNLISQYLENVIRDNYYGIDFTSNALFAPNDISWTSCQFIVNTVAVRVSNFDYGIWTFVGCEIEGNNYPNGLATDGIKVVDFSNSVGEVNFIGCHFEANYGASNLYYNSPGGRHLNLIGCKMIPGNGDKCGAVIDMYGGELSLLGTTALQNVIGGSGRNIYIDATTKQVVAQGDTSGAFTGTTTKLTRLRNGQIWLGKAGGGSSYLSMASYPGTSISMDIEGQIRFVDTANIRTGYITESAFIKQANTTMTIGANNTAQLQLKRAGAASVEPGQDNTTTLGSAAIRWTTVYATTGAINTSDERAKQQIKPVDAAVLRAWGKVDFCQYKWNEAVVAKGDKARWHIGVIAQNIKRAFESEGLDPFAYGILCHDKWDAHAAELDAEGNITVPAVDAGEQYSVRYDQALALECAYLRSKLK